MRCLIKFEIMLRTYNYDKVIYINRTTPVILICVRHEYEFTQLPSEHLKGVKCKKCSVNVLSNSEFIEKAKKVHGDISCKLHIITTGISRLI